MTEINYLLGYENLKIYQNNKMFKFSLDSVLLPNFVSLSLKNSKILDIGSGNAVIPLILTTRTSNHIDAIELQKEVYELGKKSIEINNLGKQISIYNQNIKDFYKNSESDIYDTITCNPPFFKLNMVSNNSKYKTIARHEQELNLNDIFKIAKKLLKNNGNIAIVHRTERLVDIVDAMKRNNIEPKKIRLVYPKKNKEANILLIEGKKNGKKSLKILPPLYSHNEDGTYTEEIQKYFE